MTVRLIVGALTFSSDPAESNLSLDESALHDWFSSPAIKTQPDDRANSDGLFGVKKVYRSARTVTVSGLFTGTGDEAADALTWRRISGLLASGSAAQIEVDDPAGPLVSEVILTGDGCVLDPIVNGMATYDISLLAPDPIRYGVTTTPSTGVRTDGGGLEYPLESGGSGGALYYGALGASGRITLTNDGTADVYPFFTVTGLMDAGFTIRRLDTGETLQYSRVVPAGTVVTIDCRTGEVLVDGASDGSAYLTRDDLFGVPAMSSIVVQFDPISTSSGATMTATQRDGWW